MQQRQYEQVQQKTGVEAKYQNQITSLGKII